ncbi:MgtC/SapB family protein [Fibrella forsythiae]|uniref:MgtC/SapB family protein n=1 Tax=Fibrella forsythiae TaxID=2817061 RepID=A0ABS3JSB3_9BACT|nr:MgtC/SapB family protein [Fibrella forsythiae]MBO0951782.1 MgtC/SapB family protein [Fibrella forsythiae]
MIIHQEDILRLVLALLLGGLIGAEREYRSKAAGFRTTIMISVGATLFTMVSRRLGDDRIAANIVNGIGFLGAGLIYKEESRVKGLTTAATVWSVSALGMSIGAGYYDIALIGFVIIMGSLLFLAKLSYRITRLNQTREYKVVTNYKNKTLNQYERVFTECGLSPRRGPQQRIGSEISGRWKVSGPEQAHEKCIKRFLNDTDVKEFVF